MGILEGVKWLISQVDYNGPKQQGISYKVFEMHWMFWNKYMQQSAKQDEWLSLSARMLAAFMYVYIFQW